jgi:uncharacterized cupin superfamily protein
VDKESLRGAATIFNFNEKYFLAACFAGFIADRDQLESAAYKSRSRRGRGMETKLLHISQIPISTGVSKAIANPIKPELFAGMHEGRLAKSAGLSQFGVNHITLDPGAISSLRHWHEAEDEFVYVLSGDLILIDDNGEHAMPAGAFAGFAAGAANAHHLVNRSRAPATFLVVGARRPGEDTVHYPDDPLGPLRK